MRYLSALSSPLRYPGGKSNLSSYFEAFVEQNLLFGAPLYEPFAGGASISLAMLAKGYTERVYLNEYDPLLFSFWWCVVNRNDNLCSAIERTPVSMKSWRRLRQFLARDWRHCSRLELGLACLFLNRVNFSGILSAGPIGGVAQNSRYPLGCRFNKERVVASIRAIHPFSKRISVSYGDGNTFLQRTADRMSRTRALVYVDPPYVLQGKRLYRKSYSNKQHQALAEVIASLSCAWIATYDNVPFIHRLFSNYYRRPIALEYMVKASRRCKELLISNCVLPAPAYLDGKDRLVELVGTKATYANAL